MRLKQVLMNLLGNAIKFTVKGAVTLHTSIENKPSGLVLKVKVIDTGLGISKENLPNIFDEFSQVENAQNATSHKGTGLGLAICKKIIELQGGTISVTSIEGKGSTFSFELPLKQLDSKDCILPQAISDDKMAELVGDKYVLLAEDNKLNVLLTVTILKKWGIKYDVAYNGQEAFDLFKINNYDVILTDIQMPGDGWAAINPANTVNMPLIRQRFNTLIVALTANVMKEDRDNYFKTGVNDIILKPFREKDLIEKIALTLQNNHTALRFVN